MRTASRSASIVASGAEPDEAARLRGIYEPCLARRYARASRHRRRRARAAGSGLHGALLDAIASGLAAEPRALEQAIRAIESVLVIGALQHGSTGSVAEALVQHAVLVAAAALSDERRVGVLGRLLGAMIPRPPRAVLEAVAGPAARADLAVRLDAEADLRIGAALRASAFSEGAGRAPPLVVAAVQYAGGHPARAA